MRALEKTIKTAIDMISSYLSIDPTLVATNHVDRCRYLKLKGSMFCLCIFLFLFFRLVVDRKVEGPLGALFGPLGTVVGQS